MFVIQLCLPAQCLLIELMQDMSYSSGMLLYSYHHMYCPLNYHYLYLYLQVIQGLQNFNEDRVIKIVKEKVQASLEQAKRHLKLFLAINPDLTDGELKALNFMTLSIFPATLSKKIPICYTCQQFIIFRDDLNPNYIEFGSLAKNLQQDMMNTVKIESNLTLSKKIKAENVSTSCGNSTLELLKRLAARIIGLGSLYFSESTGDLLLLCHKKWNSHYYLYL